MLDLKDKTLLVSDALVAGEWTKGQCQFDVTNPSTGAVIGQVADCTSEDAERAIQAAEVTQKEWAKCAALERADVLMAL